MLDLRSFFAPRSFYSVVLHRVMMAECETFQLLIIRGHYFKNLLLQVFYFHSLYFCFCAIRTFFIFFISKATPTIQSNAIR